MKFKIDENLPVEAAELIRNEGYDAVTVWDQNLGGAAD
jgi:predicted nuclease of predicted toxin-antitoxin system